MKLWKTSALVAMCVVMLTLAAFADTLTLKDGTVLEGKIIEQGSSYWVKTADGKTQMIAKDRVKSWDKGATAAKPVTPPTGSPTASGAAKQGNSAAPSSGFGAIKAKADRVEQPILAVQMLEKWIDDNPSSPDLATAKTELGKWEKLAKDNSEKINGKWVGGDERKKLI